MRRPTLLVIAVALVAASACGGGSPGGSSSTSSKKPSSTSSRKPSSSSKSSTTSTTRNPLAIEGNNGPGCRFIVAGTSKRFTQPGPVVEYLNNAVAQKTACYDKVSFTFDKGASNGLPPGYTVEYRKKPYGLVGPDGKTALATSTGGFRDANAVLYVEMKPAATDDLRNPSRPIKTYLGNLRLLLKDMRHVVIVEWIQNLPPDATPTSPNDGKVVWLIGLDKKQPFTVDFASEPVPHVNVLIMH